MAESPLGDEVQLVVHVVDPEGVKSASGSLVELELHSAGPDQIEEWDSLGHVTMASELEREFGISFEIDDLMEMETIATILTIIERKLQS